MANTYESTTTARKNIIVIRHLIFRLVLVNQIDIQLFLRSINEFFYILSIGRFILKALSACIFFSSFFSIHNGS